MLNTKNYLYLQDRKRMKLPNKIIKYLNAYTNLILLRILLDKNTSMLADDDKEKEYLCGNKRQGIKDD